MHGLPFFTGGDCDGSRVNLLLPAQEDGAGGGGSAGQGHVAAAFSDTAERAARRLDLRHVAPGPLRHRGFTIEARKIPHKGGATLGYRVSDGSPGDRLPA